MRILQTHSDWIEYEPIQKEIAQAEDVEKKVYKLNDVLVVFTTVEAGDNENVGKKAINEIKEFLKNLKANRILIYPFVHLSNNPAKPNDALKILKSMESYAKSLKIETYRAPFGWNKRITNAVKGHPLAEQSKVFVAGEKKEEKSIEGVAKRLGKKPTIEAEKLSENDHRIIGQNLDLYSFHEVAPGMVFLHNKGVIIRNLLVDFWREEHKKRDYLEVSTPLILNKKLWEISGHWDHYKDLMFFTEVDGVDFVVKPMNCPGAILIYKTKSRSYKDLPMRYAELGLVHRNELSGVLSGLFRVRAITQDDAHIFVREDQLEDEISKVVDLVDYFYKVFGFDYHVELSTRPKDSMGSKELWDKAEHALEQALKKLKMKYKTNAGEGAFYGPKIDFHIKDSMGRSWQCATIQVDFQMPERFDINFTGDDGKSHRPVIIHRVVYGAIERFLGILVEHYQGKFPVWLSPIQVRILSIADESIPYAKKIKERLEEFGIRIDADFESNTIEYKIREAQLQKIPYILVVGKKEEESKTIAVRSRDGKVKYKVDVDDFAKQVLDETKNKAK
jgi:threonyl-tRNA synthetase